MSILLILSFNIIFFVGEDRVWCFFCVLFVSFLDELFLLEDLGFLFIGVFFNDGFVCFFVVFGFSFEELLLSELEFFFLIFFIFVIFFLFDIGFFGEMFKFVFVFILLEELLLLLFEDLFFIFFFTGDCITGFFDFLFLDEELLFVLVFFFSIKIGGFFLDIFFFLVLEEEFEFLLVVEFFLREFC